MIDNMLLLGIIGALLYAALTGLSLRRENQRDREAFKRRYRL